MRFSEYIKGKQISQKQAALALDTSEANISRWCSGVKPRDEHIDLIRKWSNGDVQPNDFYDLPGDKEAV